MVLVSFLILCYVLLHIEISLFVFFFVLGKHFDQLPKKEEVNKDITPLLFEAITVNCNYTSKIEVRIIMKKEVHQVY